MLFHSHYLFRADDDTWTAWDVIYIHRWQELIYLFLQSIWDPAIYVLLCTWFWLICHAWCVADLLWFWYYFFASISFPVNFGEESLAFGWYCGDVRTTVASLISVTCADDIIACFSYQKNKLLSSIRGVTLLLHFKLLVIFSYLLFVCSYPFMADDVKQHSSNQSRRMEHIHSFGHDNSHWLAEAKLTNCSSEF